MYTTSDECQKEMHYNTDINLIHFMTIVTMILFIIKKFGVQHHIISVVILYNIIAMATLLAT